MEGLHGTGCHQLERTNTLSGGLQSPWLPWAPQPPTPASGLGETHATDLKHAPHTETLRGLSLYEGSAATEKFLRDLNKDNRGT